MVFFFFDLVTNYSMVASFLTKILRSQFLRDSDGQWTVSKSVRELFGLDFNCS